MAEFGSRAVSGCAGVLLALMCVFCTSAMSIAGSSLPVGSADLVQVAVDRSRWNGLDLDFLPPPKSEYCGGRPEFCSSDHIMDIVDPDDIQNLVSFVNSRLNHWVESATIPPQTVSLIFWQGGRLVATFGFGVRHFSRGSPEFIYRNASDAEIIELQQLLHLK